MSDSSLRECQQFDVRPYRGQRCALWVLRRLGWRTEFPGGMPAWQGVMLVAPHTSNWDVPLGVLYKMAFGVPLNFWAKHTLFEVPVLGWLLTRLGGLPVNRKNPTGLVDQMIANMKQAKAEQRFLWVVITPEGTRKYTPQWRNGFYRVALGADVPVIPAYIDFKTKCIGFEKAVYLSGNLEQDIAYMQQAYATREGKIPSGKAPVQWRG